MDVARTPIFVSSKRSVDSTVLQVALMFLLLGAGIAFISSIIQRSLFSTIFLLCVVSVSGLVICRGTETKLKDPSLNILGYFWLLKLSLTLLLLYVGWMPQLDPSSASWGYDPQRYYFQAKELLDNHWSTEFLNLNYVGILYFYSAFFALFGHNPVIPVLVNAFVTLVATLYLVKVGYEIKGQRGPRDWTLALALFLPEMLWFDVMTSRETLVAALLLFATLTIGRYLARTAPLSLQYVLIFVGLSVVAIAAVRTSMLVPVCISTVLMVMLLRTQRRQGGAKKIVLTIAGAAALMVGPIITGYLGGYEFDIGQSLLRVTSASENISLITSTGWSENSIGLLLMPEGMFQSVLFLPPRMLLYLVAPLPNFYVHIGELVTGSWGAWQQLLTLLSAMINVLAAPFVFASLVQAIRMRDQDAAPLMLHIAYWVTFVAIAGGNLIIHDRYRVMASLMFWGCAWLGATTCSRALIKKAYLFWYGLLTIGALFYLTYKSGVIG